MQMGAQAWQAAEPFYNRLTLAAHGDPNEMDYAARFDLARLFRHYEAFWKRHICPATERPQGQGFRRSIAPIICRIAQHSYSVLGNLVDSWESLDCVRAGDLGRRNRNCRDALLCAGNALQLLTELQYSICGNPKQPKAPHLANILRRPINVVPDWNTNWSPDREAASNYRNYLTHQGLFYTVRNQATDEILVLSRDSFIRGCTWIDAEASYNTNPGDWEPVQQVCEETIQDTVAFIDLFYERLIAVMDPLLTDPAYQALWGWSGSMVMVTTAGRALAPTQGMVSMQACSNSKTVGGGTPHKTIVSSGGCTS